MNKYLFGIVAVFGLLVASAQDAEAGWLRGGRCGGGYSGPTYSPPVYYYYPQVRYYYYPSCNSGYVVSPPVAAEQLKGKQKPEAPSFQDFPQKKANQPTPNTKDTTVPPPVIRAPAPSFQDLPSKK